MKKKQKTGFSYNNLEIFWCRIYRRSFGQKQSLMHEISILLNRNETKIE